jgi:AAHS family benzoate transporter-like MFS transporter
MKKFHRAGSIGTQILLYSYISHHYPIHIRSTGIGWASAIGRFGAIVGPMMGGILLTLKLPLQLCFIGLLILEYSLTL